MRPSTRTAVAGTLTAMFLVATTALVTPVLADALSVIDRAWLTVVRVLALTATVLGMLLSVRWLASLQRSAPHLVHVRLMDESIPQDPSMRDRHVGMLGQARRRGMVPKSVTRWVSLAAPSTGEPVDLVQACSAVAAAVERMINDDSADTRLILACDMPWPAALAVGAQLPVTADPHLLELTGWPAGTGVDAPEALFSLPWKSPRSLDALAVERWASHDGDDTGRVGLILALTMSLRHLEPDRIFRGCGVTEYHVVQPSWATGDHDDWQAHRFTGKELGGLARRLPAVLATIKQRCRDRELVVAAAVPSSLAMAVGWGLAQDAEPFFAGTHLLQLDPSSHSYRPIRTHPSQPDVIPRLPSSSTSPPDRHPDGDAYGTRTPDGGTVDSGSRTSLTRPIGATAATPDQRRPAAVPGIRLTAKESAMPSNQYDASLKLVYVADRNTFFASDTLTKGQPFDVIGNVEIGKELMNNVRNFKLWVSVLNISRSTVVLTRDVGDTLDPKDEPYNAEIRVSFPGGWDAHDGDVIEAVASYRVSTGLYTDYSAMRSHPVVVAER